MGIRLLVGRQIRGSLLWKGVWNTSGTMTEPDRRLRWKRCEQKSITVMEELHQPNKRRTSGTESLTIRYSRR